METLAQKLKVEVTPVLTISEDTAYVLLGLLEMYCRNEKKTIEISHTRNIGDEDFEVTFNLVDDKALKKSESEE